MNKKIVILILVIAFIGGFLVFYNIKTAPILRQDNSGTLQKWESRVDDQTNVTVTVTPIVLSTESEEWKFDVVMDTHSVELDQEIVKVSVLVDNQGKEYKPVRWEGAEAGGHHREGVLIFNVINPIPTSVELKIKNVGGVPERSFNWKIQ